MPKGQAHAIYIHGIGRQREGFAAYAHKTMSASLKLRGITLHGQEVVWAPILDRHQDAMLKDVGGRGSKNSPAQQLAIGTLADALSYGNQRDAVLSLVDNAMVRLRSDSVSIFAHSLGCLVALDWLRSRPIVNGTLTSFGANVRLFYLGGEFVCPNQLKAENRWRNLFYPKDMLGWPIKGWQDQVDDLELSKPFWSISTLVPALSHNDYWHDKKLWSTTLPAGFR